MDNCTACRKGRLETIVRPEHTEDLGGVVVRLRNAVLVRRCPECGEEFTEIPNMNELMKAVALVRAQLPIQLSGNEIRFFRRVFDMTQVEFAAAMGLESAETISRWENGARGVGGYAEKLLRHNLCALLYKHVPAAAYDPETVARMQVRRMPDGTALPPLIAESVVVKHDRTRERGWDAYPPEEFAIAA
jgi:putative zinc finger/helix-turn-helix YgiT family protein